MNPTAELLASRHRVERNHEFFWAAWALLAAFGSYFCMYAFRKPFTAASSPIRPSGALVSRPSW